MNEYKSVRVPLTRITLLYEKGDDDLWVVTIPEIPGVFSQGETKEAAKENVLSAMQEVLAARRDFVLKARKNTSTYETYFFVLHLVSKN